MPRYFTIGEASRKLGISVTTLRDLENRGLLKFRRDWTGRRRIFTDADIEFIEKVLFHGEPNQPKNFELN